nr:retrovirus-related Pol polyprotein from transposon TNT 1-94 [Tanacetum cinerariifolium]
MNEFPQLDSGLAVPVFTQRGGQARVVKCYNCQGEGHMSRQCTHPKRPRNVAWFQEKEMLAEAQESGQILDEKQLAFLANPGISDGQAAQTTFQTMLLSRLGI